MIKKIHTLTILTAGITMTAIISCGNNNNQQQRQEPIIPVSVQEVTSRSVSGVDQFPGTVVPLNETELRAEVSGYITRIHVADGAAVTKGQKLYEIDLTRYAAAAEQAKASLAIAQSNLDRSKLDIDRYRKLLDQDAIARQIVDNAEAEYNNMQAQVLSAKAALTTATTDLNRAVITAPFSGTVGISQVRQGALVSAGSTLLNTLSSVNPIAVDFQVNERYLPRFIEIQKRGTSAQDSLLRISLPDGSSYATTGKISAIDRAIDASTGTITVRATFDNADGILRAGMNTNVSVLNKIAGEQIVIPYKAIEEQLGVMNVYVVNDSSRVEQREVKLGLKLGDEVVITEGLKNGEKIVTDGIINVQHNARITTEKQQ